MEIEWAHTNVALYIRFESQTYRAVFAPVTLYELGRGNINVFHGKNSHNVPLALHLTHVPFIKGQIVIT
jgi:hypothetical protein